MPTYAWAAGSDTLRVGLIGCGGRGTRGIIQNSQCAPGIELIAMGDLVPERLARARQQIAEQAAEDAAVAAARSG
jgi:myo-inositol 2-dehydrogenase / D-chiro-inositol 1-dehydrogenase